MYIKFRTNIMAPGKWSICKVPLSEFKSRDSWAKAREQEWSGLFRKSVTVTIISSWEQ